MGLFITVKLNSEKCPSDCKICAEVCSMKILAPGQNKIEVNPVEEDECILCDMCIERCPKGAIEIVKNY